MTEDVTKGKKNGKGKRSRFSERIVYHVNAGHINDHHPTPGHAQADGYQREMARPDCDKAATGNPVDNAHSPTGSYTDDRLSEPLTAGHASPSTGDHGAGQGRNSDVALGHEDLRQSRPGLVPFAAMRSNPANFVGQAAFGALDGPSVVHVDVMPAAERAGLPGFRAAPSGNPLLANGYRPARGSGTPASGGHDLTNVTSHAVASKGKTNLEIMKEALFGR